MSAAVTQATNLYPYVAAEEGHRDHQAEEALFLTFNVDLGYLEARLLGALRGSGARVTVLADAGVWAPDVRAVNLAGIEYHVGLAHQRTAFHPKLTVLVGPRRVLAAVGSGNLTIGGWQYNRELLTVFTGDREGVPTAVGDIRDALDAMLGAVRTDPVTARAVQRTVALLDDLLEVAPSVDTGHRVYASWAGPLIDQLPKGEVAELSLTAAFHDPDANAVRRLIARMQPRRVRVAVQPAWTHIDAAALHSVLTEHAAGTGSSIELLRDPESVGTRHARYRHGKLIEWVTLEGDRRAMTGSPNLTSVALLRRAGLGGNFELAVTGPVRETLFPAGEPVDALAVPVLAGESDITAAAAAAFTVQVLSAVTKDDALTVHLSDHADSAISIDAAARRDHPDVWYTVGFVPAGARAATFPMVLPPGSRVRAVMRDGNPTAAMFVTGERRVLTRAIPTARQSALHRATVVDLFGEDLGLLELLQADMAVFAREASPARAPMAGGVTRGGSDDGESHHGSDPILPWLWLLTQASERYGTDIACWLLAVPNTGTGEVDAVPWADIVTDEQAAGLDSDETATDVDEALTAIVPTWNANAALIDHSGDPERLKSARRRACAKSAANVAVAPPFQRLVTLILTLHFWSAGNWDANDPEPFTLVRTVVGALATADLPAEMVRRAASLAAITLTLMRQLTDVTVSSEPTLRFQELRRETRDLLQFAGADTIEAYAAHLRTADGRPLTLEDVTETLDDLVGDDPLAELEATLVDKGFTVHRPSRTSMHIHKAAGNPELSALEAVGFAQEHDGIVVWATNDKGRWACVGWKDPDLVTVGGVGPTARWRHQRLTSGRPAAVAVAVGNALLSGDGPAHLPGLISGGRTGRTPQAQEVLFGLGVDEAGRPPCCAC